MMVVKVRHTRMRYRPPHQHLLKRASVQGGAITDPTFPLALLPALLSTGRTPKLTPLMSINKDFLLLSGGVLTGCN